MGTVEGWLGFAVWLWLVSRTYGYLRDRWASESDSSWIVGLGAAFVAFYAWPLMIFVMIRTWVLVRRGTVPAAEERRRSRSWAHQRRTALTSARSMSELR